MSNLVPTAERTQSGIPLPTTLESSPQPAPATAAETGTEPEIGSRRRGGLGTILRWAGVALVAVAVACLLALTVGPILLPYRVLTVYSGSMVPTIPVGSVVVDVPVNAADVQRGQIITFTRPDRTTELVTHRVIAVDTGPAGRFFITRGDANNVQDAWRVPAVGTGYLYKFNIPFLGFVLVWLQSPIGRLLFLVIPAAALGLLTLYELWRPGRPREGA